MIMAGAGSVLPFSTLFSNLSPVRNLINMAGKVHKSLYCPDTRKLTEHPYFVLILKHEMSLLCVSITI